MKKTSSILRVYTYFVLIIFASFNISGYFIWASFGNAGFLQIGIFLFAFLPIIIISPFILFELKRTKYAHHVTQRNIIIAAIFIGLCFIAYGLLFNYYFSDPKDITNNWVASPNQNLTNQTAILHIGYDITYGYHFGSIQVITTNHTDNYRFGWTYDKLTHLLTLTNTSWTITLATAINQGILTTRRITMSYAPFPAAILNDLTWQPNGPYPQ